MNEALPKNKKFRVSLRNYTLLSLQTHVGYMVQCLVQRSWSGGENSEKDTDPQQYCHQGILLQHTGPGRIRKHNEIHPIR